MARLLAMCLELDEGLEFTSGLSTGSEPALWSHDLTGALTNWVDVGTPDGPRLHKAGKASNRVVVYCHKDPRAWLKALARERVFGSDDIDIFAFPPKTIEQIAERIDRRNRWSLSRIEGTLYLDVGGANFEFPIERLPWPVAP